MKKWIMTMIYSTTTEFEVEAETYDEAVKKAYALAENAPPDVKDLECEVEEYEVWTEDPDEDEEFEPGRPILDQMALNP